MPGRGPGHIRLNRVRQMVRRIQKGAATMCAKPLRSPVPAEQPLLVRHLMASAPPHARAATAASSALSLLAHVLVLTIAFSITTDGMRGTPRPYGEQVILRPEPEPPPPPLPPAQPTEPVRPAGPAGPIYGTLIMPTFDPTTIPEPSPVRPTDEWLFSDARGTAVGSERPATGPGPAAPPDPAENPGAFVPMSVAPELANRAAVQRALQRLYPPVLRDAGLGGQVVVWVFVDEAGAVVRAVVRQSSGQPQLDAAALEVARVMRFTPAMNHDQKVKVWVSVPVLFRVGE